MENLNLEFVALYSSIDPFSSPFSLRPLDPFGGWESKWELKFATGGCVTRVDNKSGADSIARLVNGSDPSRSRRNEDRHGAYLTGGKLGAECLGAVVVVVATAYRGARISRQKISIT